MRFSSTLGLTALVASLTSCVVSPTGDPGDAGDLFKKIAGLGFSIRETADPDKHDFRDAARVQFKDPSGDGNSGSLVDAGVLWRQQLGDDVDVGVGGEYHRNDIGAQNVESSAASLAFSYYDEHDSSDGSRLLWSLSYHLSAKHKRDRVADDDGQIYKFTVDYYNVAWTRAPSTTAEGNLVTFRPSLGLLFEDGDTSLGIGKGEALSIHATLQGRLYLFPKTFVNRLHVSSSYSRWEQLTGSGGFDNRDSHLRIFKAGLNYALDPDARGTVELEYVNGENPETSQLKEEAVLLTFKLKV